MKCHDWIFLMFTTIICCTATISIAQAQQRGRVKFALGPQKDEVDPIPNSDTAPKTARLRSSAPRASSRFRPTEQPVIQAPSSSVESKDMPRNPQRSKASRSRSDDRSSRKLDAEATELVPSIRSRKRVNSVPQNPIALSDQPTKVQLPTANIDRTNIIRRGKSRSETSTTSVASPSSSQVPHFRRRSDMPVEEATESIRKVRTFSSRSVTRRADEDVSSEVPVMVTTGKNNWRNAASKRGSAKAKISERVPKSFTDDQLEDENYPEHFKLLLKKQQPKASLPPRNLSRSPVPEDPSYSRSNEVYDSTKSPARQRRLEHASQESSDEILQVSRAIPKVRRVELKREDTARAALKSRRVEPPAEEVTPQTRSEVVVKGPFKSRRTEPQFEALKSRRNDLSAEELSPKREETSKAPFKSRRNEPQTDAKPNEIVEATKPSKPLFVPRRAEPYRPKPTSTTPRSTTTPKSSRKSEPLDVRAKYKPRVNARLQFPTLKTKTTTTSEDVIKGDNEIANIKPTSHPIRSSHTTKSKNLALDTPLVVAKKIKSPKFSSRYRGDAYSRYQPKTESSKPIYTPTIPAVSTEPTASQTDLPSSRTAKSVTMYNPESGDLNHPPNDKYTGVVFDERAGVWNMVEPVAGGLTRSDISVDSAEEQPLQPSSVTVSIFEALADILLKTPPTTTTSTSTTTTTTTTSTTELPEIIQVPELKIDSMQMSSTTVNTHLITDVDDEYTTTNEITNNDRNGRILNSVDINQKQSTTTASNDPTEPSTVPQYTATDTNTSPPLTTQPEQTISTELTDSTLLLAPTTEPTFTNDIPTNFSANSLELTTLASNPPTSLPMPYLADALTTPGSSLITRPQLISAISNFLDTSVQNASETMATSTTTTTTTATLDTDTEQSTTSDASTTLSPLPTTSLSPFSTDTPPVTISFLDLFTIQPKKVNHNTEPTIEVHPIYKEPDPNTTPASRQQKTFSKDQTTGRPVNIHTFFGTRTFPSIAVTSGTSTDRIEELSTNFWDNVTSGVATDSTQPSTTSREQDSTTYTTPQSSIRTQSLPIHLNSILGSTQKYDQTSPSKTVHTTESTTTVRSRFGNNRLPILPAGSVPIRNTTTTTSTTSSTSTTKTTSTTTTASTVTQTSPKQQQQQLSNFIPDQQVPKPIKDFSVYGILPNNTVVRKRPTAISRTLDVGLMVYGILPNRTVVRKYPNGTLAIVDSSQDVEVVDIDPKMLFNPFSELYRTSQSSLLLTTHRSTTSHRLIEGNHIIVGSSLGSSTEVPTSTTTGGIRDSTDSGSTETITTNSDDENLIQLLSENEDNLLNSTSLVEANTENAVLLDLLKRKYINSDIPSRSSNVVSLTTARNVIEESSIQANRDKDVSENTLSESSEEKRKDSSSSSEEDLLGKLFPTNGSTGPNRSNTDDDNVISHQFDTFANIGSIFTGNKGRALQLSQRTKLYPIKLVMASQNTTTKLFAIHTNQSTTSVKNDSRTVIEAFLAEVNRTHGVSEESSVDGSKTVMPLRDGASKMIDFGVLESGIDSKANGVSVLNSEKRFEGMRNEGEFLEGSGEDWEANYDTTESEKKESDVWQYPPGSIPVQVVYSNDYDEGFSPTETGSGNFDTSNDPILSTFRHNFDELSEVPNGSSEGSLKSSQNSTTRPLYPIESEYLIPVKVVYPDDYFEQLPKYLEHFVHTSTTIGPNSETDYVFPSKIVHQSTSISTTTSASTNSEDGVILENVRPENEISEPKLSESDQNVFHKNSQQNYSEFLTSTSNPEIESTKTFSTKNVFHDSQSNSDELEPAKNVILLTSTTSSKMSDEFELRKSKNMTASDISSKITAIEITSPNSLSSDDASYSENEFEKLSASDATDSSYVTNDFLSKNGSTMVATSDTVSKVYNESFSESDKYAEFLTSTTSSTMSDEFKLTDDVHQSKNNLQNITASDISSKMSLLKIASPNSFYNNVTKESHIADYDSKNEPATETSETGSEMYNEPNSVENVLTEEKLNPHLVNSNTGESSFVNNSAVATSVNSPKNLNDLDSIISNIFKDSKFENKSKNAAISVPSSKNYNKSDSGQNTLANSDFRQSNSLKDFLGNYDTESVENVLVRIETDFDDENPMHDSSTTKANDNDRTALEDEGLLRLANSNTAVHNKTATESNLFNSVFSSDFEDERSLANSNESNLESVANVELSNIPNSEEEVTSEPISDVDWTTWATINNNSSSTDLGASKVTLNSNSGSNLNELIKDGEVLPKSYSNISEKSGNITTDVKNNSNNLEQNSEMSTETPNSSYTEDPQGVISNSSNNFEQRSQTNTETSKSDFDLKYSDSSEDENLQEKLKIVAKVEVAEQLSEDSSPVVQKTESNSNQSVKNVLFMDEKYNQSGEGEDQNLWSTDYPVPVRQIEVSTNSNQIPKSDGLMSIQRENSTVSDNAQLPAEYPRNLTNNSASGFSVSENLEYLNSFSSTQSTFDTSSENILVLPQASFEQVISFSPPTESQMTHVSDFQETSTEGYFKMNKSSPSLELVKNSGEWRTTTDLPGLISTFQMPDHISETSSANPKLNAESKLKKSAIGEYSRFQLENLVHETSLEPLQNSGLWSTTTDVPSLVSPVPMIDDVAAENLEHRPESKFGPNDIKSYAVPKMNQIHHSESTTEDKTKIKEHPQHIYSNFEQSSKISVQMSNTNDKRPEVEFNSFGSETNKTADTELIEIASDLNFVPNFMEHLTDATKNQTTLVNPTYSIENLQNQNALKNFEQSSKMSPNTTGLQYSIADMVTKRSEEKDFNVIQSHLTNLEQSSKMSASNTSYNHSEAELSETEPEVNKTGGAGTFERTKFAANILEFLTDPAINVTKAESLTENVEQSQNFSNIFEESRKMSANRSSLPNLIPDMVTERPEGGNSGDIQYRMNNFEQSSKILFKLGNMPYDDILNKSSDGDDTDFKKSSATRDDENSSSYLESKFKTDAQVEVTDDSTDPNDKSEGFDQSPKNVPFTGVVSTYTKVASVTPSTVTKVQPSSTQSHTEHTQPPAVYYPMSILKKTEAAPAVKATFVMPTNMQAVVESSTETSRIAMIFPKDAKPQLNEALPGHFHKMYTEDGQQNSQESVTEFVSNWVTSPYESNSYVPVNVMNAPSYLHDFSKESSRSENKLQSVDVYSNLKPTTLASRNETAENEKVFDSDRLSETRLKSIPKQPSFSGDKSSSKFDLTTLVPKEESKEPVFVPGGIPLDIFSTPGGFLAPEESLVTKPSSLEKMFVPGGVPQDLLLTTEAYSEVVNFSSSESPYEQSPVNKAKEVYSDTEHTLSPGTSLLQDGYKSLPNVKIADVDSEEGVTQRSSVDETTKFNSGAVLESRHDFESSSKYSSSFDKPIEYNHDSSVISEAVNDLKPILKSSPDNISTEHNPPSTLNARQEVTQDEFKAYKVSLNFLESALEKVEYEVKDLKENFQKSLEKSSTQSPPTYQEEPRFPQTIFQAAIENEVESQTFDSKQLKLGSQASLSQQVPLSEPPKFDFQSESFKIEPSTHSDHLEQTTVPTLDIPFSSLPSPQFLIGNPQANSKNDIQQSNAKPPFVHQMSENALSNMRTINSTMSAESSNISISKLNPSLKSSLDDLTTEEELSDSDQNHSATTSISQIPQLLNKIDVESWTKSTPPEVIYTAMNPAVEAQTRNHTETQYTTQQLYTNFHESSTLSSLDNNILIDNLKNSINTITEPKRVDNIPTTPTVFVVTPGTTSSTTSTMIPSTTPTTTMAPSTTTTSTTPSTTTSTTTTTTTTSAPTTTTSTTTPTTTTPTTTTTTTTPIPTTMSTTASSTTSSSTTSVGPQTTSEPKVAIDELQKNIKLLQELLGLQASLKPRSSSSSSTSSTTTTTLAPPLPMSTTTTTTTTTTNKASATSNVDDVNFLNTLRQLLLVQQQATKKPTTSTTTTTTTTTSTTPKTTTSTTTAKPITISPQNLEDLLNSFSTPSFSTTPKSNDQDDIAFLNSLRDIGKLRVTTATPPTFANRIIELALQNRQATPTPMSPVYIPARISTTTPAFAPLPKIRPPAILPSDEIERHRQDQASLSADLSLLSTLLGRRITAEDLPQITQQFGGNRQSVSAPRRPTTTPRTTPRTTTTTTTEKPMSRDEIAEIEKNLNLLSSLLGRPVSLNELPLIMQELRSGRKTSGARVNLINPATAKTTTTTFRPRPTVSVQSQTPISQEEVIELLKDPSFGPSDQLNIYGKTNDAVLAAVLKQRGIGPTHNNIPVNDLFLQGPTPTPYHTTRAPPPPPAPPTQRRPLLDGLAWLWRTWQDTAPGTRPSSRNNRQPTAAASTRLESPLAIGVFGGAQPAPPAATNSGEGGEYAELQYPQNPNPSFGQGNGLLTAAFGVTRAVTQFLGAAFQGAAKSVQSAFLPQAVQQNSLIGLSG